MKKPSREAVVIGGSAGSLEALLRILPVLPAAFPLPVLIVVHLPPDKESVLPDLIRARCRLTVREARDKEPIENGTIYFAPPDYHLLVESDRSLSLSYDEPLLFSRPSIDVLFDSAAEVYGLGLIAIILSGANQDGAQGLKTVTSEGGAALVQAPGSSYAQAMPMAALAANPQAKSLSPEQIAEFLLKECCHD